MLANILFFNGTNDTWEARISNNPADPQYKFPARSFTLTPVENVPGYHFFFGPEGDAVPYGLAEPFSGSGHRVYLVSVAPGPDSPIVTLNHFDPS